MDDLDGVYEHYKGGRLIDRVRPIPNEFEHTRIMLAILEREEAGELDGWYPAGTYVPPEQPEPPPAVPSKADYVSNTDDPWEETE